jgi:hypothetical protein
MTYEKDTEDSRKGTETYGKRGRYILTKLISFLEK